jgi:hypothetical protein
MPRGSKPGERRGGRKKGTPNKITRDVREGIRIALEENRDQLRPWFKRVGKNDPARALTIFGQMAEYVTPKLQRQEKTILDATDEELLQEVRRRRAAAEGIPPTSGQPEQLPKP